MGYLSNKKHIAHVDTFLKVFLILCTIITLGGFGDNVFSHFLNQYRWQAYIFMIVVLMYTLFHRFFGYMSWAFILAIINYFAVSSAVNIWSDNDLNSHDTPLLFFASGASEPFDIFEAAENEGAQVVAVTNPQMNDFDLKTMIPDGYVFLHPSDSWNQGFMLSALPVKTSGRINLGSNLYADFAKIEYGNMFIMFIAVDFNGLKYQTIQDALKDLSKFIASQDDPVVVFGDFGMVAWSRPINRFLSHNGLSVKNNLFDNWRNFLVPQHYYIFGYEKNNIIGKRMSGYLNYFGTFTRF